MEIWRCSYVYNVIESGYKLFKGGETGIDLSQLRTDLRRVYHHLEDDRRKLHVYAEYDIRIDRIRIGA